MYATRALGPCIKTGNYMCIATKTSARQRTDTFTRVQHFGFHIDDCLAN